MLINCAKVVLKELSFRSKIMQSFTKFKKAAAALAALVCIAFISACAANSLPANTPEQTAGSAASALPVQPSGINGNYIFDKQIYMNMLSSFLAYDGLKEYYTFTDDKLIITDSFGIKHIYAVTYEACTVNEADFKQSFIMENEIVDISYYASKHQYVLKDASGAVVYRVFMLDNDIWLIRVHKDTVNAEKHEYIWSIFKIKKYEGDIPARSMIYGTDDGVSEFLTRNKAFVSGYEQDNCYNITPYHVLQNSEYSVFKYNASCASFLLYKDDIYAMGEWFGGFGVTSMAICDLNSDKMPELYFTFSWGSGLHRSHAAYFDPILKQVVTLDHTQMNEDIIIAENESGELSLYRSTIAYMNNFVDFALDKTELIANIVYENGKIALKKPT